MIRLSALRRRASGFTVIELMVVMTIIITLASMALVQYRYSVIRAREAVLREDLFRMREAIDQFYADKNEYPQDLGELVTEGYLRQLPVDPFTNTQGSWVGVPAEPDLNNPAAPVGVYDVKSGAEGTSLDGTSYAEW